MRYNSIALILFDLNTLGGWYSKDDNLYYESISRRRL